jgi:thiamine-phosphate pyrophosphorylase
VTRTSVPDLYLVSPPRLDPAAFADQVALAFEGGPVACLQLWMPDAGRAAVKEAARRIEPLAIDHDCAFVLNGPPELAADLGFDGIHLDDPAPKAVKAAVAKLGNAGIVGVSAGTSRHAAMEAAEAGASYVSFGPCFDTPTKDRPAAPDAIETLGWWASMMEVPCVAVGGITPERASGIAATGCEFICAVSAVWNHPEGPGAAVAAFHAALADIGGRG